MFHNDTSNGMDMKYSSILTVTNTKFWILEMFCILYPFCFSIVSLSDVHDVILTCLDFFEFWFDELIILRGDTSDLRRDIVRFSISFDILPAFSMSFCSDFSHLTVFSSAQECVWFGHRSVTVVVEMPLVMMIHWLSVIVEYIALYIYRSVIRNVCALSSLSLMLCIDSFLFSLGFFFCLTYINECSLYSWYEEI